LESPSRSPREYSLLGDKAFWVGDFEGAASYYARALEAWERIPLLQYRTLLQLIYIHNSLRDSEGTNAFTMELQQLLTKASKISRAFAEIGFDEALKSLQTQDDKDLLVLAHLVPVDQVLSSITNLRIPERRREIMFNRIGVFSYGIYAELYRIEARAYTTEPIDLSRMPASGARILHETHGSFYGEFADLDTIFVAKLDGVLYCLTPNYSAQLTATERLLECLRKISLVVD